METKLKILFGLVCAMVVLSSFQLGFTVRGYIEAKYPHSSVVTDHSMMCAKWGGSFVIEDKHIFCYKDGAEDFLFNIDLN